MPIFAARMVATLLTRRRRFMPAPTIPGLTLFAHWDPRVGNYTDTARTIPAKLGDNVQGITDLSGNGHHATQATQSKGGTLGPDYWTLDGGDDNWLTSALSLTSQPILIASQVMISSAPASTAFIIGASANNPRHRVETTGNASVNAGTTVVIGAQALNVWHTLVTTFNGASSAANLDGVGSGTINPGANGFAAAAMGLFAGNTGLANFFGGKSRPILIYTGTATDPAAARATLTTWYAAI